MTSLRSHSVARLHALACVTVLVVSGIAGCQSPPTTPSSPTSPSNQQQPNWPEKLNDFRFRWKAEPGIDLVTGWAVPLRAYLESWLVIYYTANLDAGYPGYKRATPELLDRGSPELANLPYAQKQIRGYRGSPAYDDPNQNFAGNEDLYILRMESLGSGFRGFVCDATYGVYQQAAGSGHFKPLNFDISTTTNKPDFHNMRVWRIEFSDRDPRTSTTPPVSPALPQDGPLPAPSTDVFGPWFVTGAETVAFWWDTDYPGLTPGSPDAKSRTREAQATDDELRQECLNSYPASSAERAKRATTVLDTPPPVQPAVPGWPAKSS